MNDDRKWWFHLPDEYELENMRKLLTLAPYNRCPKCNDGCVVIEIHHCYICGCSLTAVCNSKTVCDYKVPISDPDNC